MMHPHLPAPRPFAVPSIGFVQNISASSEMLGRSAFEHAAANLSDAATDRIVWLPVTPPDRS
jgi:hypothetical protein